MNLTADDYLRMLCARISEEERADLESNGDLVIGSYNRATMLRMLRDTESREKNVDTDLAYALENALRSYLDRYMADMPRGTNGSFSAASISRWSRGNPCTRRP